LPVEDELVKLKNILLEMGAVLVAFSGGMDSTFLLKIASDVLGEEVLAATAGSEIGILSKQFDLPTWNKPHNSCFSTRFPYGTKITKGIY